MAVIDANALNIYTDGSCFNSPRRGGVAIRFIFPEYLNWEPLDLCPPGYQQATNNQMELKACCIALIEASKMERAWQRIVIYTDSIYVCDNYGRARSQWSNNRWLKSDGAPVLNAETWKELLKNAAKNNVPVDIKWVKGHAKNENNKAVDRLAKQSVDKVLKKSISTELVRKKSSSKLTEAGCVKLVGQTLKIRILSGKYLKTQKISRYRYEVLSKRSKFFGCLDFVFSKEILRAGHRFLVCFNKDQKYPQIVKVIKDLTLEDRKNNCL